jgi:hypothetical protein
MVSSPEAFLLVRGKQLCKTDKHRVKARGELAALKRAVRPNALTNIQKTIR